MGEIRIYDASAPLVLFASPASCRCVASDFGRFCILRCFADLAATCYCNFSATCHCVDSGLGSPQRLVIARPRLFDALSALMNEGAVAKSKHFNHTGLAMTRC
jgi:hypothetical protein